MNAELNQSSRILCEGHSVVPMYITVKGLDMQLFLWVGIGRDNTGALRIAGNRTSRERTKRISLSGIQLNPREVVQQGKILLIKVPTVPIEKYLADGCFHHICEPCNF